MALNKEAERKQRRRELDARRSRFRVRLGSWPESWSTLKDQLGFSLHSELAQFLLDSYSCKEYRTCPGDTNEMISVTGASLDQLILLVHGHGQQCPLTPSLQSDTHRQEIKPRPPEENPATSMRSSRAAEAGLCFTYVCKGGHAFTWCPAYTNWRNDGEKRERGSAVPPGWRENREQWRKGLKQEEVCKMRREKRKAVSGRSPNDETDRVTTVEENEEAGCHSDAVQLEQEVDSQEGSDAASLILPAKFSERTSGSAKTEANGCQNSQEEIHLPGESRSVVRDAIPHSTTRGWERRANVPETTAQRSKVSKKNIRKTSEKDQFLQISSRRKRKPTPNLILSCEFEGCGKIYTSRQHLNHHMKYQHFQPKTFSCSHPSCGKSFNFKKHLKEHEKLHSNQRDFICEFCARAFRTSSNLSIHRRIHTGEKPLQCEVCGFTCCQKASLNWHMRKHDAERSYLFACDICGRRFEKRDNVTAHQSKSHPDRVTSDLPKEPTVKDF